ncbi:hypothetical protein QNO07_04030 [Streptomyces sp. 549]|uniref:COG4315 family predicted lipoprotein n=1 Tax=Streptomyces sp. 549 TaxID=3049076 RepID=UPI0024C2594C|nr:hypothetical protein [Streptomyces sp. 549]MDK1472603.1 hypothetical protein [Streptomyces sp. 549]
MRARIALFAAAPLVLALTACGGGGPDDGAAVGANQQPPAAADPAAPAPPAGQGESGQDAAQEDIASPPAAEEPTRAPAAPPKAAPDTTIKVVQADEGRFLVDGSGRTLYGFTKDKGGKSNCDADCIAVWPALITPAKVNAGDGVQSGLLRQTDQSQGVSQATYGEWPLYYYVGDAVPGDVNGQGLDDEWFVVAPDGKLIK